MIINIRGTNGSGKTTLVRQLIGEKPNPVDLLWYPSPTKRDPDRRKAVEGYGNDWDPRFLAIGSYRQGCGGLDTVPSFELQQGAIRNAYKKRYLGDIGFDHILCEGVLASTVAGSWLYFFQQQMLEGHAVCVVYLDTPLEVCLERIKARQIAAKGETREIKVDQVAAKIKAINNTRQRFIDAGITTWTLNYLNAAEQLRGIL